MKQDKLTVVGVQLELEGTGREKEPTLRNRNLSPHPRRTRLTLPHPLEQRKGTAIIAESTDTLPTSAKRRKGVPRAHKDLKGYNRERESKWLI